jgi:hypothetical protein
MLARRCALQSLRCFNVLFGRLRAAVELGDTGPAYSVAAACLPEATGEVADLARWERRSSSHRLSLVRATYIPVSGPAHGPGAWFSARLKDVSSPAGAGLAH